MKGVALAAAALLMLGACVLGPGPGDYYGGAEYGGFYEPYGYDYGGWGGGYLVGPSRGGGRGGFGAGGPHGPGAGAGGGGGHGGGAPSIPGGSRGGGGSRGHTK